MSNDITKMTFMTLVDYTCIRNSLQQSKGILRQSGNENDLCPKYPKARAGLVASYRYPTMLKGRPT